MMDATLNKLGKHSAVSQRLNNSVTNVLPVADVKMAGRAREEETGVKVHDMEMTDHHFPARGGLKMQDVKMTGHHFTGGGE